MSFNIGGAIMQLINLILIIGIPIYIITKLNSIDKSLKELSRHMEKLANKN